MEIRIKTYICAFVAALFLVGCSDDALVEVDGQLLVAMTIEAQSGETRTALSDDASSVTWTAGDEIAVYDFTSAKRNFTTETSGLRTTFTGKVTAKSENYAAVYPYALASETAASSAALAATLPSTQRAVANGFPCDETTSACANISVAKGSRNIDGSPSTATFHNVGQLLRFSVPEYAAGKITSITFTAPVAVAGKLNIDYSGDAPNVSIAASESKTITVLPPSRTTTFDAGTYYIVCAPVQLQGFTMTLATTSRNYTVASATAFGGVAGHIYSLGAIDLVSVPNVTASHVYADGVLQGTKVQVTNAPIEGRTWSVSLRNSGNTVVRTLTGTGDLASAETDASWPYLPTGSYSATYTYTTSNGKTITRTISNIAFSETPRFGITFTAYTSFSYYKGDGVEKSIVTANGLDPMTIYEPKVTVTGVAERILTNSHYTFNVTNTFSGSLKSSSKGVYTYANYSVSSYNAYSLSTTVSFDGTSKSASKTLYITGLPYRAAPPSRSDWTGSANDWDSEYVRLHNQTITKSFYAPEDMSVTVKENVAVRHATVGTTYSLKCSGTELVSIEPGYMTTKEDGGSYPATLMAGDPTVSCSGTYGNPASLFDQGTHVKVYSIIVQYR